MHFLRSVVLTVLLGLLMALTQAPARADHGFTPAVSPSTPMAGELFELEGTLPVELGTRSLRLQWWDGSAWRSSSTSRLVEGGATYEIPTRITKTTYLRVAAEASGSETVYSHSVRVSAASQYVAASVKRICTVNTNTCGNQAEVAGYLRPVRENRLVTLQYKSGSTWKSTSVRGWTDSNGTFAMTFSISGWSQWTAKQLRIAAGSFAGSTYGVSAPMSFMPGPTRIGRNVLRVDVAGGAFPQTKGVDYTGAATLIRDGVVEIDRASLDKFGVRGSTTAGYPKKPYNLRFRTAPSGSVFGMPTDRRWTLLAMYADQSYVRDKTALDLGRKLPGMTWNPDSEYVELFVNSEYKGAYLLTEKVDIDGDRVAVDQDTGMIMEVDMDKVSDPRKGFKTARGGLVFAFKEPDSIGGSEGITPAKLSAVKNKVASVESYLYTTNRKYWYKQIEGNSAADFHLAVEYFKDIDSDFWRSKYFSWDMVKNSCVDPRLCDGRLHFGPLWDFDKSIGNVDATNPGTAFTRSYRGFQANGTGVGKANRVTFYTHWFVQLWKVPSFRAHLAKRWAELRVEFWRAAKYEVEKNKALIGWGAANDRARWKGYAKLYKPKGPTYDHEVYYVKSWLLNRFSWMDRQL